MKKTLRSYQKKTITEMAAILDRIPYCFLSYPTGLGKTFTAASFIKENSEESSCTVWLTHRNILAAQAETEAAKLNLTNFMAMTWQKASNLEINLDVEYVVVDEIHWGGSKNNKEPEHKAIVRALNNLKPKFVIFLSATPMNLDNMAFGDVLPETQATFSREEAIDKNLIMSSEIYNIDFEDDGAFLEKAFAVAKGPSLVICKDIEECDRLEKRFRILNPDRISGVYHSRVRFKRPVLAAFKARAIEVLFSVSSLKEGANFPFLENVIVPNLNIHNIRLTLQIVGRISRTDDGKYNSRFIYRESESSKSKSMKAYVEGRSIQREVELVDVEFSSEELVHDRALIFSILLNQKDGTSIKPAVEVLSDKVCRIRTPRGSKKISLKKFLKTKNQYQPNDFERIKLLAAEGYPRPARSTPEGKILKIMLQRFGGKPSFPEHYNFIAKYAPKWILVDTHTQSAHFKNTIRTAVLSNDDELLDQTVWRKRWVRYLNVNGKDFCPKLRGLFLKHRPDLVARIEQHNNPNKTEEFFDEIFAYADEVDRRPDIPVQVRRKLSKYTSPRNKRFNPEFTRKLYDKRPDFFSHLTTTQRIATGLPLR